MMHKVTMRTRVVKGQSVMDLRERYRLTDNIANHMGYIYPTILYNKYDFTFRKITNFYKAVVELRQKWYDQDDDEVTEETLLGYVTKKKIDALGIVNSIPMSQKLFMADVGSKVPLGTDRSVNFGMLSTILLTVPVLKEKYRFSNKEIMQFFDYVKDYIVLYCTKQPGTKELRVYALPVVRKRGLKKVNYLHVGSQLDPRE